MKAETTARTRPAARSDKTCCGGTLSKPVALHHADTGSALLCNFQIYTHVWHYDGFSGLHTVQRHFGE